jgi:hypothetical protein
MRRHRKNVVFVEERVRRRDMEEISSGDPEKRSYLSLRG